MRLSGWALGLALVLIGLVENSYQAFGQEEDKTHFLNEWTAEIPGGALHATDVAEQHGFRLVRELTNLPNHYILVRSDTAHRSKRSSDHHTLRLQDDHRVAFVQQQQVRVRQKREENERERARAIAQAEDGVLDDPEIGEEWYLSSNSNGRRQSVGVADLNVKSAWEKGYTGKNVVVTILDDGIEYTNPDLTQNYDPEASHDFNDNDRDPAPRYDPTNENKHGTRCAGEVAMTANNKYCGVGVAFDSRIGGVRMLDGSVTDRVEAESLGFNVSYIDIYSASWGPTDNGMKMEGPGPLTQKAILKGITEGRKGKGVLYVWASGNGGNSLDSCNADGYSSSIYTLAVSSSSQFGHSPWYTEKCASTLTTASSSGLQTEKAVTTTDLHHKCTSHHTGTSAAAPMAAGVLALLLEANPDLTWRDVQHIVVHTSRKDPLAAESGWYTNAAGYQVNLKFGFGLMDAAAMIDLAGKEAWTNVGPQRICQISTNDSTALPQNLSSGNFVEVEFVTDGCLGQDNEINYLEHVVVHLNLSYPYRGRISVELESPAGTVTVMMPERNPDRSHEGFQDWPLTSVHTWGEKPQGTWKLRVADKTEGDLSGQLRNATLTLYGTKEQPEYRKKQPKDSTDSTQTSKEDTDVDDTINDVKSVLNSNQGSYLHHRLEELLKDEENGKLNSREIYEFLEGWPLHEK